MKKATAGIIVVSVAIALGLLLLGGQGSKTPESQPNEPQSASSEVTTAANTIKMDANGFEPQTLTIKAGETVAFMNIDSEEHWPASDPHPTHTDHSELDPRRPIAGGQSWTFTLAEPGIYNLHDHLFPAFRATVTVDQR